MSFNQVKDIVLNVLKGELVKRLLIHLIGTTAGFKAWIIKLVATELWDKVAVPIIELGIRKGRVLVHTQNQKIIVKKIKSADTIHDWRESLDDLN